MPGARPSEAPHYALHSESEAWSYTEQRPPHLLVTAGQLGIEPSAGATAARGGVVLPDGPGRHDAGRHEPRFDGEAGGQATSSGA